MDKVVKKMWLEALRGGEYKQGRNMLRDNGNFCCLGVLCDIYGKEKGIDWDEGDFLGIEDFLPSEVQEWAGLESDSVKVDSEKGVNLTTINDKGFSFEIIADIIEEQL